MSRLFVSQELLDQWSGEGKVELVNTTLTLTGENRSFEIQPGVRFVKLAAGEDRQDLTGRVKTEFQMSQINAELYMNSVLVGEDAYDVQTGFLCEVPAGAAQAIGDQAAARTTSASGEKALAAGAPGATAPKVAAQAAPRTVDERSALAQFLLENLS